MPNDPQPPARPEPQGNWLGFLFYIATVAIWSSLFVSIVTSIVSATFSHEQNLWAMCVLVMATIYLAYINRKRMTPVWEFGTLSIVLLGCCYACMLAGWLVSEKIQPFFLLASFCFIGASFVHFAFGKKVKRVHFALIGGFVLYLIFLFVYPEPAKPYSEVSDNCARWMLEKTHPRMDLSQQEVPVVVGVILFFQDQPQDAGPSADPAKPVAAAVRQAKFLAATMQFNGFGLLCAALLECFIFLLYRKTPLFAKLFWLIWTGGFVFLANVARIYISALLIDRMGMGSSVMIIQFAGLATLYLVLWALWYMLAGWPLRAKKMSF